LVGSVGEREWRLPAGFAEDSGNLTMPFGEITLDMVALDGGVMRDERM
jgi:hypothetical protein